MHGCRMPFPQIGQRYAVQHGHGAHELPAGLQEGTIVTYVRFEDLIVLANGCRID
jgi:hypothetical protein